MTVYILGAGASVHAKYPLTNELGSRLIDWAAGPGVNEMCRVHLQELFEIYGDLRELEKILTDFDNESPDSKLRSYSREHRGRLRTYFTISIAEYFRTLRLNRAPLYDRFVREKLRAGDVVISFNYDVACELALRRAGLWEMSDGYGFSLDVPCFTKKSDITMLKLHGSTNWLELIFNGEVGIFQVSDNSLGPRPVIASGEFEFFGYPEGYRDPRGLRLGAASPAIIIPTQHKRFYTPTSFGRELETFWTDLWQEAERAINSAERIVVIGYSMPLADERAATLLLGNPNHALDVDVYSGSSTMAIRARFANAGYSRVYTSGISTFQDFLSTGEEVKTV
jgi:hypothetical protein